MPKVCNRHRFGTIGILMANASVIQVADHFGVLKVSIFESKSRKMATEDENKSLRSGRPRVITSDEDRHIRINI